MSAKPQHRERVVAVRLTRAEVQTLKKAAFRHESLGQVLRRLALETASADLWPPKKP